MEKERSKKKYLFVPNINFEETLTGSAKGMSQYQQQLQFMPLLFLKPHDALLVSMCPDEAYLTHLAHILGRPASRCVLLQDVDAASYDEVSSWGYTHEVDTIANQLKIPYMHPDFDLVKRINSKVFSFEHGKKLPGARLVRTQEELRLFLKEVPGKKVLKSCFGYSGLGHIFIEDGKEVAAAEPYLAEPYIAEPWVDRLFDFSTQWQLSKEGIRLAGVTHFESSRRGRWKKTMILSSTLSSILPAKECPYVAEHVEYVRAVLEEIRKLGFFGYVGIDAMVYDHGGKSMLQPIVEINARMTMSLAALLLSQELKRPLSIEYGSAYGAWRADGLHLLPEYIKGAEGHLIRCKKQLQGFLL